MTTLNDRLHEIDNEIKHIQNLMPKLKSVKDIGDNAERLLTILIERKNVVKGLADEIIESYYGESK